MSNNPYILTEIDKLVFDTNEHDHPWYYQDPYAGVLVETGLDLEELTASLYFVVPDVVTEEHPPLNVLTIAKGLTGDSTNWPSFEDPVLLRVLRGGVFADVTYYPRKHAFRVGMNAGSKSRRLIGVILPGAPPERIRGRILELYVEVSPGRIFTSVNDHFLDGDVVLDATGPATGGDQDPWGADPSGNWFVASGRRVARHAGPSSLPVGFGISNLRITLGSRYSEPLGPLVYRGALDRLVDPFLDDDEPFDPNDLAISTSEQTLPESLLELAQELGWRSGDARRWAERARALAEETEHLETELPEVPGRRGGPRTTWESSWPFDYD